MLMNGSLPGAAGVAVISMKRIPPHQESALPPSPLLPSDGLFAEDIP